MTCSTCRHYRPDPSPESGDCRRHAPQSLAFVSYDEHAVPSSQASAIWPPVTEADGCGDWEAIKGAVRSGAGLGVVHSEMGAPRG